MPFEPPSVDTLEAFEPPSVDSLEETKTPGFLGPAFPLQEGEPPIEPQQTFPSTARIVQPPPPMLPSGTAPVTQGGPPAPIASLAETMVEPAEMLTTPRVTFPRAEIAPKENVALAVGKEALNLAAGIPEFFSSDVGLMAGVAGAVAPTATSGAFTLQMMKDVGNQVLSTVRGWANMTPAQKAVALTDIAGTGVLGFLTGKATAKGLRRMGKTEPTIAAAEPILPQAAQAAKETKGAEYATEERNVPQDISGERAGDDALRTPTEAGVGGGVRPTAPVAEAQAPSPAPEQSRVLLKELTPEERAAKQRALDEALGQETAPTSVVSETVYHGTSSDKLVSGEEQFVKGKPSPLGGKITSWGIFFTPKKAEAERYSLYAQKNFDVPAKVVEAKIQLLKPKTLSFDELISQLKTKSAEQIKAEAIAEGHDGFVLEHKKGEPSEYVVFDPKQISVTKSTPPPKETPTAPSAAEPSQLTPATQGISEATTPSEKAQELPALRKADVKSDPRLEMPGITKQSKPNSLIVALRDLESVPVKEIVLKSSGDPLTDAKTVEATIRKYAGQRNISLRESLAVTTGPNGRAILKFGISPRGMTWASAKEWIDAVEGRKAQRGEAPTPQVSTEPFLGKTKAEWTPEYYKSLSPENRRAARAQVISALKSEGAITKVTQESKPPVVIKGIHELLDLREKKKATPAQTLAPEPPVEPLQAGLGIPGIEKIDRKFNQLRQSLTGIIQRGGERKQMDQTFDATETMANVVARQATNQLRLNGTPAELEAIYPFIESKGDINRLTQFIAQATGKNDKAVAAANYAMQHWNDPHFQALATRAKAISDSQIAQEQAAGINTEYREAYLPHIYDQDLLMGFNRPFVIAGKGTGIGTGFKKGRTFDTIYDAIEAGYPVKTLNAADALEPRIRSGQKLINRVEWSDSFRHVTDPVDGEPVVTSLVRHARAPGKPGWEAPPAGYVRRTIIPGVDVAVHEGYASLFDALTGTSRISGSVPGKLALEAEGALKHGLLLFDTYHVSRILQKELFLTGPTKMGWRKGLTLLEYSDADLAKALHEGFITQEMADFARANRGDAELLMRSGLNVGRIQENLYNSVVRQIPILGKFNKWVFEKMTRGAMLQSGLIELERVQRDFGLTKQQAALKVARDLNVYFGNLGRQGLFKSSTAMDVARLVGLAPQWVEGMLRTEVGSVAKAAIDPIKYRRLAVSSLPLSVGTGLAAYFVATQIVNMVTRGHPTWQNPEKGHKFDAWIPDVTGKTAGYFLSLFSVPAEITHDMIRYVRTEPDTVSAVSRILSNKASPLWRASKTFFTGKDWDKQKIVGSWNRIKASAMDMVPIPIGAAPLVMGEKYPGQAQRQITASVGIKTEPAPTGVQQISEVKRNWGLNNPDPKIRHTFEENLKAERAQSDYIPLRRALQVGDMKTAGEEYDKLLTEFGKKSTDIRDAIKPFTGGKEDANGIYRERKNKPIGGMVSEAAEKKFFSTLTPDQRKAYAQALKERELAWSRFLELMKSR